MGIEGAPWAAWKRKPWHYRARRRIRGFFTRREFHRILSKWHISPWKLIPTLRSVYIIAESIVVGDTLCDATTQRTVRIESPDPPIESGSWTYRGKQWLVTEWPATNLVWRFSKMKMILDDGSVAPHQPFRDTP